MTNRQTDLCIELRYAQLIIFAITWYIVERLSGDTLSLYTFGSADFFLGLSVTFVLQQSCQKLLFSMVLCRRVPKISRSSN